jgi:hypothetical protein
MSPRKDRDEDVRLIPAGADHRSFSSSLARQCASCARFATRGDVMATTY